jgi:hypothetical protein
MMKQTKAIFFVISLFFFIITIPLTTYAFSLQVRGEYGQLFGGEDKYFNDGDNFFKFGIDCFPYEGERIHFFLGLEHLRYKTKKLSYQSQGYTREPEVEYLAKTVGLNGGAKIYINPKYKMKPYISIGFLYCWKVSYDTSQPKQDYDYYVSMDDHQVFAGKVGLGFDTGISKNLTLGIELNYTGPVSQTDMNISSSGVINFGEPDKDLGDLYLIGLGTTLRYHF